MITLLCDIDGTLLQKRTDPGAARVTPKRRAINQSLAEAFDLPDIDFRQGMVHGLTDWLIAEGALCRQRPGTSIDGQAWRRICARAEALFTPWREGDPVHYDALPGVPETLDALVAAGCGLGLVSGNVSFFAVDKLRQAGLDPRRFGGPCGFGDHARGRDQLVRLAMAQARAGDRLVVLGDTIHDVAGAWEVGLPFLGVGSTGLGREQVAGPFPSCWLPDLTSPEQVLAAVERLASPRPHPRGSASPASWHADEPRRRRPGG